METIERRLHLGVDVGGTFTDIVYFDAHGNLHASKVPSTPAQPGVSTIEGIRALLANHGLSSADVVTLQHTHGSTIAINTLIERVGSVVGMITTKGFRDTLELGRLSLPHPMDYNSRRPLPLIPRARVKEIGGRLDADGLEIEPLDEHSVLQAAAELVAQGTEVIVICLLHSYRNSEHEQRAQALITRQYPEITCELSALTWPQAREYERAILATINAYVRPAVTRYLDRITAGTASLGVRTEARIIRSNGGMQRASTIRRNPVTALLSGPAAGVSAAAAIAESLGMRQADLVTVDVGGTSVDVGVVRRGAPVLSAEEHIADFPVLTPGIAVSSVGAGGGSIIWLDETGQLKIGPRSVGADPGPACYGLGSTIPCLTDAFLIAGWLNEQDLLAGRIALNANAAHQALRPIAVQMGISTEQAADAAIALAIAMMGAETSGVLSRRGVDAPEFSLVAFGGAGPMIGALLAESVYVNKVLIPAAPGVLSALGAVNADVEIDFIRAVYAPLKQIQADKVKSLHESMQLEAAACLAEEGETVPLLGQSCVFSGEMRYQGQGFDVATVLETRWLATGDLDAIGTAFHAAHKARYGYCTPERPVWLRELRLHAVGTVAKPSRRNLMAGSGAQSKGERDIRINGRLERAKLYERRRLGTGDQIVGPAIINQADTTILVPGCWTATQTDVDVILLDRIQTATHTRNEERKA